MWKSICICVKHFATNGNYICTSTHLLIRPFAKQREATALSALPPHFGA